MLLEVWFAFESADWSIRTRVASFAFSFFMPNPKKLAFLKGAWHYLKIGLHFGTSLAFSNESVVFHNFIHFYSDISYFMSVSVEHRNSGSKTSRSTSSKTKSSYIITA